MSSNEAECKAAGLDPAMVAGYRKKLEKLMASMKKDGLMLFGGGDGSSLRPINADPDTSLLIVASLSASNIDGGAGAYSPGADGLLRGE
ncbi:hypothetical protein [Pseudomonas sp. MWU12-2323]|uniref:hypothetical protein n=1 Tax=Pseudomonas sp. MWU12-2323 TaxID=2651296 RepID=UPI00128C87FA|nr:hypothetical protein [Pseudomonas sp. MWU12-2323]MPQ69461.1 hypothetical protein [Pseudomonas sp. MWU12-2323]